MATPPPKAQFTAMAGEFCVMEKLFRLGHVAALTLGNAKTIDILVNSVSNKNYKVSVKAGQSDGKWPIGKTEYPNDPNLIFIFLLYKNFTNIILSPEVWVIPAPEVNKLKRPWLGSFAIYNKNEDERELEQYKNAWHFIE